MRIAATADLHCRIEDAERVRDLAKDVAQNADALVLAGDLTDHGRPEEMEVLLEGLRDVDVPILAVFGNHDHEFGDVHQLTRMLKSAGIHVLDRPVDGAPSGFVRDSMVVDDIGFAGVKGFCGGFDDRLVRAFGEGALKRFVAESVMEADHLRSALRSLDTEKRVAITHFAPTVDTLQGEPPEIHPFLGTSRLGAAIDDGAATLALHGHAHHGSPHGKTRKGTPVHNVSLPVLHAHGNERGFSVFEV